MHKLTLPVNILLLFITVSCSDRQHGSNENRPPADANERPLSAILPAERQDYYKQPPPLSIDDTRTYQATIITGTGNIVVELDAFYAPVHVNNFIFLVEEGFYDGLTFHRVETGVLIQGGDPLATGKGGPGYTLPPEIGLPHVKGAFAAARRPDRINPEKRSSGSQFYITQKAQHHLDADHSVYGMVVSGFETVAGLKQGSKIIEIKIEESDG
jgi:peptidyl-prolyl cis-trans isomerase B (cyclophilin B)